MLLQAVSPAAPQVSEGRGNGNSPELLQQPIDKLEQPRHSGTFWAVEPPLPIVQPAVHHQKLRNSRFVPICFDNPESSYRDISTYSLARGIAVLSLCKIKVLVQNADWLYSLSRRLLGPLPTLVMRHTFFAHFCAGEDQEVRHCQGNSPVLSLHCVLEAFRFGLICISMPMTADLLC